MNMNKHKIRNIHISRDEIVIVRYGDELRHKPKHLNYKYYEEWPFILIESHYKISAKRLWNLLNAHSNGLRIMTTIQSLGGYP